MAARTQVVLPILLNDMVKYECVEGRVPRCQQDPANSWMSAEQFYAGLGIAQVCGGSVVAALMYLPAPHPPKHAFTHAQAMPGPLFAAPYNFQLAAHPNRPCPAPCSTCPRTWASSLPRTSTCPSSWARRWRGWACSARASCSCSRCVRAKLEGGGVSALLNGQARALAPAPSRAGLGSPAPVLTLALDV